MTALNLLADLLMLFVWVCPLVAFLVIGELFRRGKG